LSDSNDGRPGAGSSTVEVMNQVDSRIVLFAAAISPYENSEFVINKSNILTISAQIIKY
jgi:hypothetical protein